MTVPDAAERLRDDLLGTVVEQLDADIYYFGLQTRSLEHLDADLYYFGLVQPGGMGTLARQHVLEKLREWKKNDPKPWADRSRKRYFSQPKGRLKRDWPAA